MFEVLISVDINIYANYFIQKEWCLKWKRNISQFLYKIHDLISKWQADAYSRCSTIEKNTLFINVFCYVMIAEDMRTYYKQKSKFSITSLFFLTNWILSHYFLLIFCFICIFFILRFRLKQPLFGNSIEFPRKMEKLIQFTKFFRKNDAYYWNHWSMRSFAELFLFVSFHLVYAKIKFHLSCFQSLLSLLHKKVLCLF